MAIKLNFFLLSPSHKSNRLSSLKTFFPEPPKKFSISFSSQNKTFWRVEMVRDSFPDETSLQAVFFLVHGHEGVGEREGGKVQRREKSDWVEPWRPEAPPLGMPKPSVLVLFLLWPLPIGPQRRERGGFGLSRTKAGRSLIVSIPLSSIPFLPSRIWGSEKVSLSGDGCNERAQETVQRGWGEVAVESWNCRMLQRTEVGKRGGGVKSFWGIWRNEKSRAERRKQTEVPFQVRFSEQTVFSRQTFQRTSSEFYIMLKINVMWMFLSGITLKCKTLNPS